MDKVALITGGTRGIGLGIATQLAAAGYHLALNGMRPENNVKDVLQDLERSGVSVFYIQGDIGKQEDRRRIVAEAVRHFRHINVLVNNAGVAPRVRRDILEVEEGDYDYLLDINLKGPFFLSQLVAKHMTEQKKTNPAFEASIITINSISAEVASTNRAEYCISKAGLAMLTRLLAVRLGEVAIPVYEVRPGIIETDMIAAVKGKYEDLIAGGLTIEKRLGNPGDIGKIVATLAGGNLPYATGQVIMADGGLTVQRL